MSKPTSAILWFALFMLLFLLSQSFWSWADELVLGPANFPVWIFYFLGLQIALAILLMVFAFTHWDTSVDHTDDNKRE